MPSPTSSTPFPTAVTSARLQTYGFYIISTLVAVLLTLSTPNTRLWNGGSSKDDALTQNKDTLNGEALAEVLVSTALAAVAYYMVQGSDPGYITEDHVQDIDARYTGDEAADLDEVGLIVGDSSSSSATFDGDIEMQAKRRSNLSGSSSVDSGDDDDSDSEEIARLEGRMTWHGGRELGPTYKGISRKHCLECGFKPPLRSHHCKTCDRCVATFDHHCFFINTCIGERNHCRFWVYCFFQAVACWTCISVVNSGHVSAKYLPQNTSYLEKNGMVLVSSLYIWPLALFCTTMFCIHSFFAVTNMTTFEVSGGSDNIDYLKGTKECDLPFSKGIDGNLKLFCCHKDAMWSNFVGKNKWGPTVWRAPKRIIRDSEDWWEHPWENKYWSCC
ncbi:hypothetical protein TrVE_jg236 [Triparma verrucosa]|uniref:Palmitoyltransferase n=1 Tax=Triparma verrucosa TaxID=1606542 RepID=A0A9W7FN51_9STRA|nr:hypothetical protein TrVE_jg236 [Triparma verrucosa]